MVILDGEDDFVNMLRHVLGRLGMTSEVVRHEDYVPGCLDGFDLVIVGPGPGDPRDGDHPKIARLREAVGALLEEKRPFLAVCLGHQTLCHQLGIPLAYKDIVFQGTQSPVDARRPDRAGRVLQHLRRAGWPTATPLPDGVSVDTDPATGDVNALAGPALPRPAVPRRVDPDPARLRPGPRPGRRPPARLNRVYVGPVAVPDVVVVDHHDSYTWNLVHLVAAVTGVLPTVVQHDEVTAAAVLAHSHVLLSPGPGHPADDVDFAVGREVLRAGTRPVLGVCLGMQGLVLAYGGTVERVPPAHGEVAAVDARRPRRVRRAAPGLRGGALPLARGGRRTRRAWR